MSIQPNNQLNNLPQQFTSFVGRTSEIRQLVELLAVAECRLLTLTGPGGVGKTRLAVQTATNVRQDFAQGIRFVPLQGIQSSEFLVSAIAEAAGFAFSGHQPPQAQLLNYLENKNMLLLLDNFEQLVEQGGPAILLAILHAAPAIKLFVTSREVLNLKEEWLYPLQGLPVPASPQLADSGADDAVQLFVARARQLSPDFSLARQQDAVLQICQLTEGMPLAVELAASWTKRLSCQTIAAEIRQNTSFLTTPLRNVPDRHRSMATVFDYSWQLLNASEQRVFMQLSVFYGGFQQEAAEQVTQATLTELAALVDKSLLRREADQRYYVHELLRQFAQAYLETQPELQSHVHQAHCAYYAAFLDQRSGPIESGDQQGTVAEIEAELDNVRAAWQWAIAHIKILEIQKLTQTFTVFCHYQSRYLEAANIFGQARDCLAAQAPTRQTKLVLANVLVRLGWFHIRLGKFAAAQTVLTESRNLFTKLNATPIAHSGADPLPPLSILATIRGDFAEALSLGELARQSNIARNDLQNLAFAYYVLTSATLAQGDYETARQHAQEACAVAQRAGNRWFLAYCLNEWGNVARATGDFAEAEHHFQESYNIREAFDDPEGMAVALNHLGEMAVRQGGYDQAQRRYQQSLTIYQQINDSGGLAMAHFGLGQTACALEDYANAAQNFQQALAIAAEIGFMPLICAMLIGISEIFRKTGYLKQGIELLVLCQHHPASDQESKDRASRALEDCKGIMEPAQYAAAIRRGQENSLEGMIPTIQATLAALLDESEPPQAASSPKSDQAAPNRLTERELEVLRLMAAGRTNREIGSELVLAIGSVKWYASQIYSKLQVSNRTEAAAKARQLNLLF